MSETLSPNAEAAAQCQPERPVVPETETERAQEWAEDFLRQYPDVFDYDGDWYDEEYVADAWTRVEERLKVALATAGGDSQQRALLIARVKRSWQRLVHHLETWSYDFLDQPEWLQDEVTFRALARTQHLLEIYDDNTDNRLLDWRATDEIVSSWMTDQDWATGNPEKDYQQFVTTGSQLLDQQFRWQFSGSELIGEIITLDAVDWLAKDTTDSQQKQRLLQQLKTAFFNSARNYLARQAVAALGEPAAQTYQQAVKTIENYYNDEDSENIAAYDQLFDYHDRAEYAFFIEEYQIYELLSHFGVETVQAALAKVDDPLAAVAQLNRRRQVEMVANDPQTTAELQKYQQLGLWRYLVPSAESAVTPATMAHARQLYDLAQAVGQVLNMPVSESLNWRALDSRDPTQVLALVEQQPQLLLEHAQLAKEYLFDNHGRDGVTLLKLYRAWQKGADTSSLIAERAPGEKLTALAKEKKSVHQAWRLARQLKELNPNSRFRIGTDRPQPYLIASTNPDTWALPDGWELVGDQLINSVTKKKLSVEQQLSSTTDQLIVTGLPESEKPAWRQQAAETLSMRLDAQPTDQSVESIADQEIELTAEEKIAVNHLIEVLNRERRALGLPERWLDESMVHLYAQEAWQSVKEDAVATYWQDYQTIRLGHTPKEVGRWQFMETLAHELVHAFSHNVSLVTLTQDHQLHIDGLRVGLDYQDYFLLLNEAITQYHANLIISQDRASWSHFYPDPEEFEVDAIEELDLPRAARSLGIYADNTDSEGDHFLVGSAYQEARVDLDHFLDILVKRSDDKLNKQQLYEELVKAQMTGQWRELAHLVDQTLGPKMFAHLGRATREEESFTRFVQELKEGKTAAAFNLDAMRERQRRVFEGKSDDAAS